jgi:hypothetical protein
MKDSYTNIFENTTKLYWVPSYLAREDPSQHVISPQEFIAGLSEKTTAEAAELNDSLKYKIVEHANNGQLVILLAGGGGGSLDEWARQNLVA